ncbi:MAG: M16 family metallopeptidase [Bradymonadia bacterium]
MTLLLQPGGRSDVCSVQSWLPTGSMHDPIGQSGLAHFFEHLMFTGTAKHPEGKLDEWVEENGGQLNAATWLDWTYYHAELPTEAIFGYLEREADRFERLSLEPTRLERERLVVLNERREQVESEPEAFLSEKLWASALGEHVYGRPTIGTTDEIKALSSEDCAAFYHRVYRPQNLTLAISGRFDSHALIEHIRHVFSQKSDNTHVITAPHPTGLHYAPGFHGEYPLSMRGEKLYLGMPAPALQSEDFAALEIAHHTIMEGEAGRIQRQLINEDELVTYASGFLPSLRHPSLYEMGFELRRGVKAETVLERVHAQFEILNANGITEKELERARNRIELDVLEGLQTVEQKAHSIGFWETVTGDCKESEARLNQYQTLDVQTVNQCIRSWWAPSQLSWTIGRCQDD